MFFGYHRRLSFLAFDDKGERSFSLVSVMQYFSRIFTVSLSTGRDFDKSVLTALVRILHWAGEIFTGSRVDLWKPLIFLDLPGTFAVIVKPKIGTIKTINTQTFIFNDYFFKSFFVEYFFDKWDKRARVRVLI